jgi:hypothetical protein
MTNPSHILEDLLNDIEINGDPTVGSAECTQFSLACLALIRHKLPPIAERGVATLRDYLDGRVSLETVVRAKVACWEFLGGAHKDAPLTDPIVAAVRAVIFPLEAQRVPQERDIVDHLAFFLEFVNDVEPHYEEEEALLRTCFSKCLGK